MKILFINTLYHPYHLGGAEKSLQILAEGLVEKGNEVVVICLGKEEQTAVHNDVKIYYRKIANLYWPFQERHNVIKRLLWNIIDCNNKAMGHKVRDILMQERPDIVHTNNILGFSPWIWDIIKHQNLPLIHTLRDHFLLCPRSHMFRNEKRCETQCLSCKIFSIYKQRFSKQVDCVLGISDYILKRHLKFGWFANSQQDVIYNASGRAFSRNIADPADPVSNGKKINFGFIGRLDPHKGIKELCQAFQKLTESYDAGLIVAGSGEDEYVSHLKSMTQNLAVRFLGFVKPEEFYNKVDVVVVPSTHNEAFGRSVVEAYSYGIPVIASALGGLPEIIRPNKTGLIYDAGKPDHLVECMKQMCAAETLKDYHENCMEFVDQFSTSRIVREHMTLYKSILN